MKSLIFTLALTVVLASSAQITEAGKWLGENELKGNQIGRAHV